MATSTAAVVTPTTTSAARMPAAPPAAGSRQSEAPAAGKPSTMMRRACRSSTRGSTSVTATDPRGSPSRATPSTVLLRLSVACICGMRLIHDAPTKPMLKKTPARAMAAVRGDGVRAVSGPRRTRSATPMPPERWAAGSRAGPSARRARGGGGSRESEPVHQPAVPGQQAAHVLDAEVTLDHRLAEVTERRGADRGEPEEDSLPPGGMQQQCEKQPARNRAEDDRAREALPGLLRADLRRHQVAAR